MAVIGWSVYSCPHCARNFSETDIVAAHYSNVCPGCNLKVAVNGEQALARGQVAAFIALAVISVGATGIAAAATLLGVDDFLFEIRYWPAGRRIRVVMEAALLVVSIALMLVTTHQAVKAYARIRLTRAKPRAGLRRCLQCGATYDPADYRDDTPVIRCANCHAELQR